MSFITRSDDRFRLLALRSVELSASVQSPESNAESPGNSP
jgi:hypothetical protein